jgi:hypothetical protein
MVEKLELETTAQSKPYKVSWLQKGHRVMVTKQFLVEFKIGEYKDDVMIPSHYARIITVLVSFYNFFWLWYFVKQFADLLVYLCLLAEWPLDNTKYKMLPKIQNKPPKAG